MGEMIQRAARLRSIKEELARLRLPEDMYDPKYDRVWDRRMALHAEIVNGMTEYRIERNSTEDAKELRYRILDNIVARRKE